MIFWPHEMGFFVFFGRCMKKVVKNVYFVDFISLKYAGVLIQLRVHDSKSNFSVLSSSTLAWNWGHRETAMMEHLNGWNHDDSIINIRCKMASGTTARPPQSESKINVKHIGTHVSIRMHLKLGDLSPYTIEHYCCYFDFVLWSISVDVLLLLLLHAQEWGEWAHTDIFSNYRIHMHRYMPRAHVLNSMRLGSR